MHIPHIIYKTSEKIEYNNVNTLLTDIINSMSVPQDALHQIYVCDPILFKETAIELGYTNVLETDDFTVYGLVINKCVLLKDFLFAPDVGISLQISTHTIRHEFGHILDSYYRGHPFCCTLQEKIYKHVSEEYNAEKYCRNFTSTELEEFFRLEIEKGKIQLIDKINKTPEREYHKLLGEFLNTVAKIYSHKSFLKICDMDQLFENIKPNEEFEKFISTEWNFYFNKNINNTT